MNSTVTQTFGLILYISVLSLPIAHAQSSFAVASIRPSAAPVQFEHDGKTETEPGSLRMRDVTVATCIKWSYGVQDSQIAGPAWLDSVHFDILAKADRPVGAGQLRLMMQTLLADRFQLAFHREKKELRAYALLVAKGGHKLQNADPAGAPFRENSATGTIARATTIQEFADFISGPLRTPVVDMTGLKGRYDFTLDFTSYLPTDPHARPDVGEILIPALQGELGLKLESRKMPVEVMIVDRVEKPSGN
jgi:uncharacterized protein (TIGR03435 family)